MKIKIYFLCTIACIWISINVFSQAPEIDWEKTYGGPGSEQANCIQQTRDGGFIICGWNSFNGGMVTGNHGDLDVWVVKTDSTGNLEWQNSYGGSDADYAYHIIETSDSGYVVAATSYSNDGDVSGHHGSSTSDAWIFKIDSLGNLIWQNSFGGPQFEKGNCIIELAGGGYVVASYSNSINGDISDPLGNSDYWIFKLDENGILLWDKNYGGTSTDNANSIIQTRDGGFFIVGQASSDNIQVTGNHGSYDCWVVKTDIMGEIEWSKCYGGLSGDYGDFGIQTNDSGYLITSYSTSNDGDVSGHHGAWGEWFQGDAWVIKIDSIGNLLWERSLGSAGQDRMPTIAETFEGDYVLSGYVSYADGDVTNYIGYTDMWVINLDSLGTIKWQSCYGGTSVDIGNSILQASDGAIVFAGLTYSIDVDITDPAESQDFWIVKLKNECAFNQFFLDADADGYGNSLSYVYSCSDELAGYVLNNGDCNDLTAAINPAITEICNSIDDNCNGLTDDELAYVLFFADADEDGYGDLLNDSISCMIFTGYVLDSTDCDDFNELINPSAYDICNNVDENCNGLIDDDAIFTTYYFDLDEDGFGNLLIDTFACNLVTGYISDSTDCNDSNILIFPTAAEICNTFDDNCNITIDEGLPEYTLYLDYDLDEYGNANIFINTCFTSITGYVNDSTDCSDSLPTVHPGAVEICDFLDNNCNGMIDETFSYFYTYLDADGDLFGNPLIDSVSCTIPDGFVENDIDCDDSNPFIYPGASEILDGFDNNCNEVIDEGFNIVEDLSGSVFSIYPNPSNNLVILTTNYQFNTNTPIPCSIADVTGKIVLQFYINSDKKVLDVSNFATGVYYVKVVVGDFSFIQKLVIN